ncbi:hypothetical protein MUP05_02255 [Candidatus Bathyarchaeota archaeon]|nr:hypothetical protein [Candidatus Bathyarchaeota archaeon]
MYIQWDEKTQDAINTGRLKHVKVYNTNLEAFLAKKDLQLIVKRLKYREWDDQNNFPQKTDRKKSRIIPNRTTALATTPNALARAIRPNL